ncbi:hypothetical protein A3D00_05755 [Candidatus Woesebacteria bacterium RIFCSPHIGHO2_02_FULL_38_9]|uniref:Nucleotidyl transferase AbiEii/AbiGii toxin family protein n=1 Tax=Candidatus Woesebacteria bacterium RIFCSPHIGHO2_01_FULL_39_28 TaxID=1802496 RepID=A0A1F7YJC8_9BACT|nr:MAG: hypothetical protein A2627_02370 [Candidatus Woesebacteria bacterium RIFCSPHIGHO2_01_FULL_39_28]OGM34436.1 MAG: hypothetical protein A3D00_05755 [Candidatus Woesebacteria bacterium RIFCSPHIGHO2_02_FULL_38_9]OGM57172.1 MAG: hypothetical protein A3A50_03230 [Candidatus Woesebacteria bacterium RIFCSPLOWO2_01_FULL_38_20]
MINKNLLEEKAIKWQTTLLNVVREYLQHRFLSILFKEEKSSVLFFKGGTALRTIFNSPRFSEDLDFSLEKISTQDLEKLIETVLLGLEQENIKLNISDSKVTSGGYLFDSKAEILDFHLKFVLNLVEKESLAGETILVEPEITPSYTAQILARESIFEEKLKAALSRQKSRDIFDLYFILRSENLRKYLSLGSIDRNKLVKNLEKADKDKIENDLKQFLPNSFHILLKNLPEILIRELE